MLCLGVALLVAASVARADDKPAVKTIDVGAADAVFAEAEKLKEAGQHEQACEKFRESLRINPNAIGTILNVAICDQDDGKIASALVLFEAARDRGTEQALAQHVALAKERIAQIAQDVPYLAVAIADRAPDTQLAVNGQAVELSADGTASVPVDPGTVTVLVSQPGRVPFETKLDVKKAEHKVLTVPKLRLPVTMTINKGRKRVGEILAIGGAGLFVAGAGVGIYAVHDWYQAWRGCNHAANACNPSLSSRTNNDVTIGDVGTGIMIGGAAVAAVGAYLWFFGPHDERLAFAPRVDAQQAGIVAFGRF
jgi:hypothetical protein